MRIALTIQPGYTPILQSVVRDASTGLPTPAATVACTFRDLAGVLVAAQSWPVALLYVPGSQGVYRCALDPAVALVAGQQYKAEFAITVGGITSTFVYDVDAVPPGGYDGALVAHAPRSSSAAQRLQEALDAYHQLIMGKALAMVKDQNGEEISYSITNRAALAQYIAMLQREVGLCSGPTGPATVTFGPRGVFVRNGAS